MIYLAYIIQTTLSKCVTLYNTTNINVSFHIRCVMPILSYSWWISYIAHVLTCECEKAAAYEQPTVRTPCSNTNTYWNIWFTRTLTWIDNWNTAQINSYLNESPPMVICSLCLCNMFLITSLLVTVHINYFVIHNMLVFIYGVHIQYRYIHIIRATGYAMSF